MSEGQAAVVHVDVVGRFEEFENRINQLESQSSDAGERAGGAFGGKFNAGLLIAAGGALALAGAVAGIAASTVGLAQEAEQNVDEFQSRLGASREEAEKLGAAAEEVFGNNWTGSLTEAGEAVANVRREIKGLADEDIASVTGATVAIAETFEQEQAGVATAVQSVMQATGVSAQEATDFITAGFQKGLDSSGDFLDTLNEYGPQFEKTGISADQLFSLLETGAAKGALGTDKIADAYKEFSLTVSEVSDASIETYNELGLSHSKIVADINSGKMTTAEAFELVTNKLNEVQGVADKTRISAAVFGGAGEDMAAGITGIDLTKTKLKDLQGATDSLNQRYTSFGDLTTGMWRKVQIALLPVGKELLGMANEAVPHLNRAFDQVAAKLPGLIKQGIDSAKQFGATAINVYNSVKPAIETTVVTVQKLSSFIERNKEVLIPLTAAVGAGAAAFGIYRAGVIAVTAAKAAWAVATTTATAASVALRAALTFMTGPVGLVIAAVMLLVGAGVALYRNWDEVKAWAEKTWGRIKEIVANAISGAMSYLQGVDMKQVGLDIVQGLVNGILAGPRLVLAAARGLGSAVINGVKGILNIQSPSRVMQELGEFTGQGFIKGLESEVPSVRKAAQGTAKAFMDAFSDLKSERASGLVDLTPYIKTLEQASASLKAKMATVKEGTPAYTEWLKALTAVQGELSNVKGKSTETASAAKGMTDEMKRGREQIAQGEGMDRYVAGLRSATTAQLAHALETAKARGEVERYNAIREEQKRRTEVATQAEQKATDATRQRQQQLANNRAQIAAGEAQERYVAGLKSATDAQLRSALALAREHGETEKYNAIKAEQARRTDVVTAAQEKAREATQRAQQQLADNRSQIAAGESQERWVKSLRSATDGQLAAALATARANGEVEKYNTIKTEQTRRTESAASAQEKAAEAARREAQAAADGRKAIADGREYDAWRSGLASLTDEQLRASAASLEAAGNQTRYNDVMGELERRADSTTKAHERWSDNLNRLTRSDWVEGLKSLSDAEVLAGLEAAQAAENVDDYNAYLAESERRADAASKTHEVWVENLAKMARTDWVNGLKSLSDAELAAGLAAAKASENTDDYNAYLAETKRRAEDAAKANERWTDNLDKLSRGDWVKGLRDLSDAEVLAGLEAAKAAQNVDDYNAYLTESQRRADDAAKAHKGWTDNLAKIARGDWVKGLRDLSDAELAAGLAAALAAENTDDYNTYLAETQRRADDASKAHDRWTDNLDKLSRKDWIEGLKALSDAELLTGLAAAQAGENVDDYNAYLTESQRRADDAAKAHERWTANLERISQGNWVKGLQDLSDAEVLAGLEAARASENVDQFNAYLAESQRRADAASKAHETWADSLEKIARGEWLAGLKGLSDAELDAGLAAAKASESTEDFNAYLAEQKRRSDEASKNTDVLTEARKKLTEAQVGGSRPFASELAALEAMRGKPGVVASELDDLIAAYKKLQTQTEQKKGLEDQMNTWGNYAKQLVPLVTEAFALMAGASNETADAWAQDMGSMVNDLVSLGTSIAKGDWAAAAVQVLTTIFTWFTRNAKAANEAAKATAEYNKQFKFSDNGYQTRTVTTYTTGIFLWETTHYKEAIDSVKRDLALAAEGGFANGIKDGFSQALAANDFSLFGKSLKTTVGKAVLDGLIESLMQGEIPKNIIGPAIQDYIQTGNTDALMGAVDQATVLGERFFNDVLKPVADKFGLLGTDDPASLSATPAAPPTAHDITNTRSVSVNLPSVAASLNFDTFGTFSAAIERAAPKIEAGGESIKTSAGEFGVHIDRLDRILSNLEYKPNPRDARGF